MDDKTRKTEEGVSSVETLLTAEQASQEQQPHHRQCLVQGDSVGSVDFHMPEDDACVAVKRGEGSQFDILQFQNSLYECIEELKIRRIIDAENEDKINQLVSTQHDHQRAIKEEIAKNTSLSEKHSQEMSELRRQHEERIHQLEAEKSKLALAADSWEKEMKELKDDIKTLQLTKYSLEKTIKDQEQRLQMQGSIRSAHLSKMTELEALGKDVGKQCSAVTEQIKRLEVNVKESHKLNSRLSFINQHQTCVSESLKTDLKKKTEEIVSLRALLHEKPNQQDNEVKAIQSKLDQTEQELKQVECTRVDLSEQLDAARTANKTSLEALERSQVLAERHLASSNQNAELASSLSQDIKGLKCDLCWLREDLCTKEEEMSEEKQRNTEFAAECKYQEESLRSQLRTLQEENQSLISARETLEELNSNWSKKNIGMVESIRELQEKITAFEKQERGEPKMESKGTNTEAEQRPKTVQEPTRLPEKKSPTGEPESIYHSSPKTLEIQESKDSKTEELHELGKAFDVSACKIFEDSSSDQISMQIEPTTAEQAPISAQSEQSEASIATQDETASQSRAGDNRLDAGQKYGQPVAETEEDRAFCLSQGAGSTNSVGSDKCDTKAATTELESKSTEVKHEEGDSHQAQDVKDGTAQTGNQEVELPLEITPGKEYSNDVPLQPPKYTPSLGTENQKKANAPDDAVSSFKEATCEAGAGLSGNQVVSQGDVNQLNLQQEDNQEASHEGGQLSESQKAVCQADSPEKLTNQYILKKTTNQAPLVAANSQIIPPQCMHQRNYQTSINPLGSCRLQNALHPIVEMVTTEQHNNKKDIINCECLSNTRQETNTAKEILPLIDSKDVKNENNKRNTSCGLGMVQIANPLSEKCSSYDRIPVTKGKTSSSSPSCINVFSRNAKRSSYVLPGFSLLTTQPRHGVTPKVNPSLSLPSSSPSLLGQIEITPTSDGNTVSENSSLGKDHNCPNPPDQCPLTKQRESSQDWPNFAEEFDSGPNSAPLSIDYSTPLRAKPPHTGSKRPAPAHDNEPLLFSDEENEADIKSDVASQISRIQSFLRSDRLKRPRRSSTTKEPVV